MIVLRVLPKKRLELELSRLSSVRDAPEKFFLTLREGKGGLRPHRFRSEASLLQPKQATSMLRAQRVYLSDDEKTREMKGGLEEMLAFMGVRAGWVSLCRFCFFENRVTPMPHDYFLSHGEKICFRCAEAEIRKEAVARNVTFPIKPLLIRLRSVERVTSLLEGRLDLSAEATKVDEIPAHTEKASLRVSDLPIADMHKEILKRDGVETLMPVQALAVKHGLLSGKNLLIVSATASGKTLLGELAGIKAVLAKKKFLFLVPLVALANQKYEDFRKRYPCRVSIRVGMSRIRTREELVIADTDIDADIVVGTYEGVDFLLRCGETLGEVGCIVVDEIHTLADRERGARLDNLCARLRVLYPQAQFLFLSATVGNPAEIASEMRVSPLVYDRRPIPLERHLALTPDKKVALEKLVVQEWSQVSRFGYHGQSLIFTHSRRKCEYLANHLKAKGVRAEAYHAGLPYFLRRRVEEGFARQKTQAVVTTAALSAGVDFPASCVIFESVGMGINPLTISEFHQMLGRAGRPGFHEKGKVYLLVDPQTTHGDRSEDEIATHLLHGKPEDLTVEVDGEGEKESALACFSSGVSLGEVNEYGLWRLDPSLERHCQEQGFVKAGRVTPLGVAASSSFLSTREAAAIRNLVLEGGDVMELVVRLLPFESVYLTHRLKTLLKLKAERLFSGSALDVFSNPAQYVGLLPAHLWDKLLKLQVDLLSCKCKDSPWCDCGMHALAKRIIEQRRAGMSPAQISRYFAKTYSLMVYAGDVFSYLDEAVHKLEAVERIALVYEKGNVVETVRRLKREIEG